VTPFPAAPFLLAAPLLLAAAPLPPAHAPAPTAQARTCIDLVRAEPAKAVASADDWRKKGGGLDAAQCGALALAALERWSEAAVSFEAAALEAGRLHDLRAGDYWAQAGNAWLAGGDPARARKDFDSALAEPALAPRLKGEVHLDRARASVAAGDAAGARVDIDRALALVPADPVAWYLSAALARRQSDFSRAKNDIAKALALAPEDPQLLLEAGTIAGAGGDAEAARTLYARAAKAGPTTEAGKAAAAALAADAEPQAPR
jgi:tetratricopeptide (TPR) repeat protein